jgi:Skp family chaperone for outer membrane proteins
MKNKIFIGITLGLLTTMAQAAESKKTTENVFNVDDVSTYGQLEAETIEHKQLNDMFKKYHKDYLKRLSKINKEMDSYKKDIIRQIDADLKNADKAIADNQKTFDKNCKEIESENAHKQCQDIQETVFNIQEQKKGIEVEKTNFINKIESDRSNRIKGLYTNYINIIGQHKTDYNNSIKKQEKKEK